MKETFPTVSHSPETAEVIAWDLPKPARRKADGAWIFGAAAVPSADELNDYFERVTDPKLAAALDHEDEARAAWSVQLAMDRPD